ncbi:MAG: anti-sigma factor antagonist [Caldilineae bacterium]|nr:MAG: anti-sigma factor antagonist [Caldilineae bacterium]
MEIISEQHNGVTVLRFSAPLELTAHEAPDFQTSILQNLPENGRVVLDMAQVTFIDSSGLGILVGLNRRLIRNGGELRLARPTRSVATVFEITRLHRFFEIYDTVEEAVTSFED